MRAVRAFVTVLIVGALLLLGALIAKTAIDRAGQDGGPGSDGSPSGSASAGAALPVAQAFSFDPKEGCGNCNGGENDNQIPRLIDDDPRTAWGSRS